MTSIFEPKTPEAAAYMAQRDETRRSRQKVSRLNALAVSVATNVFVANTVHDIRTTQLAATSESSCQEKTFAGILTDVRLAFRGDHNAADYARAPACSRH